MSCPDCVTGEFLPGEPKGEILADYHNAYFAEWKGVGDGSSTTAAEDGSTKPKRAVLLFTDAFGLALKNSKIMADNLSQRLQCDVWVPDYFNGEPLVPLSFMVPDRAGAKLGVWDWLKFVRLLLFNLGVFIRNRPTVVDERVKKLLTLLKEKKGYERIGTVGYCFGGSTCIRFGASGLVDSVVICHPGQFTMEDVKAFKAPSAWVCAEDDFTFSTQKREEAQKVLESKKGTAEFVDHEFVVYEGTAHGFGSRPNLKLPEIKKAHEEAFEQTVRWFEKTL